jgi:hypothetical protein
MHGSCGYPDVQRIGYLQLQELSPTEVGESSVSADLLKTGPSPFRDQLQIAWRLGAIEAGAPLALEIFAIDGRKVWSTSIDSREGAVVWDGRRERGNAAPSGTYFVRMRSGDAEVETARVLKVQ